MANSSASSSAGLPKSSRFSTLKMFKINGRERPPPPPPKDVYYLQNKSMTSLSPDSLSIPPQSPLSPHYLSQYPHRRSPAPSQSTMSLVSSAASQLSVTPTDQAAPKKKKSLLFLFGKRSKSSSSEAQSDASPSSLVREGVDQGDPGVSWPSNFQHNVHVDDGLTGLPPSWAQSLADRGFSEEEIAMINAKRVANSRIQQMYTGRPDSPISNFLPEGSQSQHSPDRPVSPYNESNALSSPILTHPMPRSTSLIRKFSGASISGRSFHPQSTNVSIPTLIASPSSVSLRSVRTTSTSTNSQHPVSLRSNTASLHNPALSVAIMPSDSPLSYENAGANIDPSLLPFPNTPTRRLQVTNPNTPPPAYTPSRAVNNVATDQDVKSSSSLSTATSAILMTAAVPAVSLPIQPSSHQSPASVESATSSLGSDSPESSSHSTPQLQRSHSERLSQPPRLSLHASNDSDDWSKLVLSASSLVGEKIGESSELPSLGPSEAKSPEQQTRLIPPIDVPNAQESGKFLNSAEVSSSGWAGTSATACQPPSRVIPSPSNSSSALWPECRNSLGDAKQNDLKETPLSAGGIETSSLPISDNIFRSRQRDTLCPVSDSGALLIPPQEKLSQNEGEDEDQDGDDFLNVRRPNRDSSRSSTSTLSTSTVTGYTYSSPQIIRNASIIRRAGAYVTKLPTPVSLNGEKRPRQQQPPSARESVAQVQVAGESSCQAQNPPVSPVGVVFRAIRDSGSNSGTRRQSGVPPSPMNSHFGSDESAGSASTASTLSSSQSRDQPTPTTDPGTDGDLGLADLDLASYYANTPSPSRSTFSGTDFNQKRPPSPRDILGNAGVKAPGIVKFVSRVEVDADDSFVDLGKDDDDDDLEDQVPDSEEDEEMHGTWDTLKGNVISAALNPNSPRPRIVINDESPPPDTSFESILLPISGAALSLPSTPLTPIQRYPGWLSNVVKPLSSFIDEAIEPRDHYFDLQEIAEGESGSIFAARINPANAEKLCLHSNVKKRDAVELKKGAPALVAVKIIAITPPSSSARLPEAQKLVDLERELKLMKGLWHENILGLDALYVDLTEDTLWMRMELMERSLADIVGLVVDGLMLQDRMIARFSQDVLHALKYLQDHRIAHRDVRSDNLLLNTHGILKLTDFSNAVKLPKESSLRSDPAGVIFWQAPEMRYPNYDALKVDVWSLGATIWEMAETEPPFSDTKQVQSHWPPLTRPELWSPAFHSFLRACSDPAATRKAPAELLKEPFISNACGRGVIVQLLSQCMNIERAMQSASGS